MPRARSDLPPLAVRRAAGEGLRARRAAPPSQKGGTLVGVARARDLSNGRSVSETTLKRMVSFFARHEVDKGGKTWPRKGKGWQAWNLWGGDEGRRWAKEQLSLLEADRARAKK